VTGNVPSHFVLNLSVNWFVKIPLADHKLLFNLIFLFLSIFIFSIYFEGILIYDRLSAVNAMTSLLGYNKPCSLKKLKKTLTAVNAML